MCIRRKIGILFLFFVTLSLGGCATPSQDTGAQGGGGSQTAVVPASQPQVTQADIAALRAEIARLRSELRNVSQQAGNAAERAEAAARSAENAAEKAKASAAKSNRIYTQSLQK